MREIKFRGKDAKGEWRYGDLTHNKKVTTTGLEPRVMVGGYEVDENTVGQFTGLYDKDGKEIYEGDILDVSEMYMDEKSYLEVRFVRGVFAFLWNGKLDNECCLNVPTHQFLNVISNIHDNKDKE